MSEMTLEMLRLHEGQGLEMWYRDEHVQPTMEQYTHAALGKTGGLFRLIVRLLCSMVSSALAQSRRTLLLSVMDDIGLHFQIRDDLLNLFDEEYMRTKVFAEDVTEGKFSFPIIAALEAAPPADADRLREILRMRTHCSELKQEAVDIVSLTDAFERTVAELDRLHERASRRLESIGSDSVSLQAIVDKLHAGVPRSRSRRADKAK